MLTSIDNLVPNHLLTCSSRFRFIDPVRLVPVVSRDLTELDGGICELKNTPNSMSESSSARGIVCTYSLNSSVNGSSFRKV